MKLSIILMVLFIVNQVYTDKTPEYIKELFADGNKTSSNPYRKPVQNTAYDYIIVGAGSAGSTLANRLSANPQNTVCLLELGGPERMVNEYPVLTTGLLETKSNYGYKTVPQKYSCFGMNDNLCDAPQGKSLGGTSSISSMIYNRGDRKSFNNWAADGNNGWSYNDVLPYFLRAENATLSYYRELQYHNFSGSYISNEDVKYRTPISAAFVRASLEAGLKYIDYNDPDNKEGVSYLQATTRNGRRHSAFKAYIEPVQAERPNLHVLPYFLVTKVLIDPHTKTAYGVEVEHREVKYTILANKEVILSAGAIHSPQLLMVSGVGPSTILNNIGAPQVVDLPVGQTLYDHVGYFGPIFTINTTMMSTLFIDRISNTDISKFQNGDPSTKVSSISGYEASAFIKTKFSKDIEPIPDVELMMIAASISVDYGTTYKTSLNMRDDVYNTIFKPTEGIEHFSILTMTYHPKSKGYISIESSDVTVPPKINPNYYAKKRDVQKVLEGIKEAIRIISSPSMQAINATLLQIKVPGCERFEFGTDSYWRCSIRVLTIPRHHYVATCKMGPISDKTSVVDDKLRVHGVKNLRVVDASVIPRTIAGHTEATAYMLGEKAGDIISGIV